MLTVSLGATCYLADLLREINAPPEVAIRFVLQAREGRVALRLDHVQPDDACWKQGEHTVLVLDPALQRQVALLHLQLQAEATGQRLRFVLQRALKSA